MGEILQAVGLAFFGVALILFALRLPRRVEEGVAPGELLVRLDDERLKAFRAKEECVRLQALVASEQKRLGHRRVLQQDEYGNRYLACSVCGIDSRDAMTEGLDGCGGVRLTPKEWAEKIATLRRERA